jgi:hypothetical protein
MRNANSITGRDDFIIAQALTIAIEALSRDEYPAASNIEDMKAILAARYPGQAEHFGLTRDLRTALRMGWEPKNGDGADEARAFIAEHPGTVIDLSLARGVGR